MPKQQPTARNIPRNAVQLTMIDSLSLFRSALSGPAQLREGRTLPLRKYYESNDHAAIAHALFKVKQNWIVSYDRVAAIRALYQACRSLSYSLGYSASTTNAGDELMFFCHNLIIPKDCRPRASAYKRGELRQGDTSHLRLSSFVGSFVDRRTVCPRNSVHETPVHENSCPRNSHQATKLPVWSRIPLHLSRNSRVRPVCQRVLVLRCRMSSGT